MTIESWPQPESQTLRYRVDGEESDDAWIVQGATTVDQARDHMLTVLDDEINGRILDDIDFQDLGNTFWRARPRWVSPNLSDQKPLTGATVLSFDTGGGTVHITHGLAEQVYGTDAISQNGAINVKTSGGKNQIDGVDIVTPALTFQVQRFIDAAFVNNAYIRTVASLTGTTNNGSFFGFPAGELLFLGASGSKRGNAADSDWDITFKFSALPNATGLTVDTITGIAKKGHDYLWIKWEDEVDSGALRSKPIGVYVNRVYNEGDFTLLGI